jgi:hypothetical protein
MKKIKKVFSDVVYLSAIVFLFVLTFNATYSRFKTKEIVFNSEYEIIYKSSNHIGKCDGIIVDSVWYFIEVRVYNVDEKVYITKVNSTK